MTDPKDVPDFDEIIKLAGKVDISTPAKLARFRLWQYGDGSLKGLKTILAINNDELI